MIFTYMDILQIPVSLAIDAPTPYTPLGIGPTTDQMHQLSILQIQVSLAIDAPTQYTPLGIGVYWPDAPTPYTPLGIYGVDAPVHIRFTIYQNLVLFTEALQISIIVYIRCYYLQLNMKMSQS